MPAPSPDLRASDADRQAVVDRLRDAHEDGRLDLAEYEQRVTGAYAAKTHGELAALTDDLGAPSPAPAPHPWLRPWREWAGTAVVLNAIWAITSIASGHLSFYWPIFPLGIWGAAILAGMLSGGDPQDARRRRHRRRLPPADRR